MNTLRIIMAVLLVIGAVAEVGNIDSYRKPLTVSAYIANLAITAILVIALLGK